MAPKGHKEENILKFLRSSNQFENISETLVQYLAEHATIKNIPKGTYIWKKDEPGDFATVIVSGFVEISYPTLTGEERLIGVFGPNDIIGLSAVIKKSPFPANARSCCNTTNILKLFLKGQDSALTNELLVELRNWERKILLHHEQILREKIHFTGASKVHLKLVELLQHFLVRFGTPEIDNLIPISLTKTQLAQLIDTRVETVIRILNRWQKMGYLKMTSDYIQLLNLDGMKQSKETGKTKRSSPRK